MWMALGAAARWLDKIAAAAHFSVFGQRWQIGRILTKRHDVFLEGERECAICFLGNRTCGSGQGDIARVLWNLVAALYGGPPGNAHVPVPNAGKFIQINFLPVEAGNPWPSGHVGD